MRHPDGMSTRRISDARCPCGMAAGRIPTARHPDGMGDEEFWMRYVRVEWAKP